MVEVSKVSPAQGARVVRYDPKYLAPLAEFYRLVWDSRATPEAIAASRAEAARHNLAEPGAEIPTYLFLRGDAVLGHLTTIPVKVLAGGRTRPGYWLIGFMVHPDHRNGPIGFLLVKEAVGDLPLSLSLTVQSGPQRIFNRIGFTSLGVVPNMIRPLKSARILSRLDLQAIGEGPAYPLPKGVLRVLRVPIVAASVGATIDVALRLSAAARSPAPNLKIAQGIPTRDEIETLWVSVRESVAPTAHRDADYLVGRYPIGEGSPYRWISVRDGRALRGFLALRAPRLEGDPRLAGIRVATIADILFDPNEPSIAASLLRGAERLARDLAADALLCSTGRRELVAVLAKRGYLSVPGNLHFFLCDASGELPGRSQLSDWWLTRGDMDSDGTF